MKAKARRRPPASRGAEAARPQRRFPGWRWAAALVLCTAAGVAIALGWRWLTLVDRVQARLPAVPELADRPAVLREAVAAAAARTHARSTILAGVAELGRLYHANGYAAEAEACWQVLIAEQPEEARWCYYLADLRRAASDHAATATWLKRAAKLAPDYSPVWLRLADLAFKDGDAETAERHYRHRLELEPGDPYARLGLARLARQAGREEEARRAIAELVRDAPDFPPAQNLYAEILAAAGDERGARRHRWLGREAGRFVEAEDPWLAELDSRCHDPARLCVLGTFAYQVNRPQRARQLLERAVALAPDDPVGRELLGDLHVQTGDPERACAVLEEGIRRTPGGRGTIRLFTGLSEAWRHRNNPAEAVRVAQAGLVHWPDSFELHYALGLAYSDLGRTEAALEAYRAALARQPGDADTNFNLGFLLLAAGDAAGARACFQRALETQPTFPKALAYLGRMELEAGRIAAAAEYIVPLYDAHPGQPLARRLMAMWHLRAAQAAEADADPEGAEQHYREGLLVEPSVPELHAGLAALCLRQGRASEALDVLARWRELQPANARAALLLGEAHLQLGRRDSARTALTEAAALAMRAGDEALAAQCRELIDRL